MRCNPSSANLSASATVARTMGRVTYYGWAFPLPPCATCPVVLLVEPTGGTIVVATGGGGEVDGANAEPVDGANVEPVDGADDGLLFEVTVD